MQVQSKNETTDKNLHSKLLVAVRVRPPTSHEDTQPACVQVSGNQRVRLAQPSSTRLPLKQYEFDAVFGPESTQSRVFETSARPLVRSALKGVNCTVFAYGARGTGKTFTIHGTSDSPGLVSHVLDALFETTSPISIRLSCIELRNETLYDLLSDTQKVLEIYEDRVKGVFVSGLSEVPLTSVAQATEVYHQSKTKRTAEGTLANPRSNCSHIIWQITLEHVIDQSVASNKFLLIDLAKSESTTRTNRRRYTERPNISRALLALGNCITALSAGRTAHVPYRDSKLTRLLKDSLGGGGHTTMIACVSSRSDSFEDTCHTLEYARRAKAIKNSWKSRNYASVTTRQHDLGLLKRELQAPPSVTTQLQRISRHFDQELRLSREAYTGVRSAASLKQLTALRAKRGQLLVRRVPELYKPHLELAIGVGEYKVEAMTYRWQREKTDALLKRHNDILWKISEQLQARDKVIEAATNEIQQRSQALPEPITANMRNLRTTRDLVRQAQLPLAAKPTQIPRGRSSQLGSLRLTATIAVSGGRLPRAGRSTFVRGVRDNTASDNCEAISKKFTNSPYVQSQSRHFKSDI